VTRSETLTLPATLSGEYRFVVRTDANNSVFELNNDDNVAVDGNAMNVGAALNLSITPNNVGEAGGSATGTVTRAGDTSAALQVTLASDIGGLTLPASVTIAAGQSSANFALSAIDNALDDGNRTATLTASAVGFAEGTDTLGIIDDDQAALAMSSLTSFEENHGAVLVTITRNTDTTNALTVNLSNDQPGRMTVPASVTIAAGASSATFEVTPVNNAVAEGNRTVRISAAANSHSGASLQYLILDDDVPDITLSLATQIISEGDGSTATWGTVTRSDVTESAVIIALHGDPARARVPTYVTIGGGEASVSFAIAAVDNALADGDHTVNILAEVADMFTFLSLPDTRVSRSLLITDNDGQTLSLSVTNSILQEVGGSATATLTRNTAPDGDLVVTLTSSDSTEATVPLTVTIPDGQSSVTFAISAVGDGVQDGTQNVTVVAAATDFNNGSTTVQVTDRELPNLVVSAIDLPESAWTQSRINIDWSVTNSGLGLASGTWTDTVFISVDNMLSADDTQIGVFGNVSELDVGESYSNSVSVQLGNRVGPLYAFVVTDGGGAVTELVEGDNFQGSNAPIVVDASYIATVSTDFVMGPNPGSIQMHGFVQDLTANTYTGKAYAPVTIQVITGNTTRTITTISNSMGNFTANFVPLPGEAGHYVINSAHPNVFTGGDRAEEDSFDILGMSATGSIAANLIPGGSASGTITLSNRSPVDLTDLSVVVPSLPAGLSLATTLSGTTLDGTLTLDWTLTAAADMGALNGSSSIQITSHEGVGASVPLSISVTPLTANLVSNPGYLRSGMLRGEQTLVTFEVTNTGGAASGLLHVEIPDLPWLSLAGSANLASLAPGEKATISLSLTPSETLELLRYDGNIIVAGTNTHVSVPFQFRAVSEATGSVQVTVTDEYTYFADGAPNLAGATVTLTDPYTYEVIAQAVTDASGVVTFAAVPEGPYALDVSAPSHDRYRSSVVVTPGGEIEASVFLHRQVVSYNWTVVPTQVEDHYRITLETTFETEVPMPVVTVDEPFIMPLVIRGHTTQFNMTLRNHGLINAEQVQIRVPIDDTYIIEPLIDVIDILPAKSEVTIPVTIRFREAGEELATASDLEPAGPAGAILKCLGIDTLYTYKCVNNQWVSVPTSLAPVGCLEDIGGAGSAAAEFLSDPTKANLFSAGCDVLGMALECSGLIESDCIKAMITTACSAGAGAVAGAAAGGIGAIPGAVAGALGNWDDILECLCSLDLGLGGGSSGPGGGGGGGFWGWGGYGGYGSPYSIPVGWSVPYTGCSDTASAATEGSATNGVSDLNGLLASGDGGPSGGLSTSDTSGVCAQVRLRLEQEAVITRTAFLGTLELDNGLSTSLDNVELTLDIRDENGNSANDKFVLRGPVLEDVIENADGSWSIGPKSQGAIKYTFVPTNDAAPDAPTRYQIGGTLRYLDSGTEVTVPLVSARITVYPEAQLELDYFWQRDVYADDPFTDVVEPSEPFALGLQVVNVGKGTAANMKITSAQPEIIENEKGLLIDFEIIGSQVGANAGTNSLTVDLGTIAPGVTQTAQWNMVSSLQGKFVDYSATFEHIDDNGDMRTSLIKSVEIHELIRSVKVDTPSADNIPDYLVNDVPDDDHLPDVLYMSTGGQAQVSIAGNVTIGGGGLSHTLTANVEAGWSYLRVSDPLPGAGGYELYRVVDEAGHDLPVDGMVWRTDRSFRASDTGATRENLLHLLDYNGDSDGNGQASYTLYYRVDDPVAPSIVSVEDLTGAPIPAAVDDLDITFSEVMDLARFSAADVGLTRNGEAVTLPDLALTLVSGNTYRISGLASVTGIEGNYALTVNAAGLADLAGNAGTNSATALWAMSSGSPVIVNLAQPATPRNSAVDSMDVFFSEDMDAASLSHADLSLTRDGVALTLDASITLVPLSATTFRISGLAGVTNVSGAYTLTVHAVGASDTVGNAGVGQMSRSWATDMTAPTVVDVENLSTNPRNTVVMDLDVDFSETLAASSFDWHDITLTRDGGSNLITSDVTVTQKDADTWTIAGFNWKVGLNGTYVLTVNGAGITDLAGNAGSGSASETWVMDIVAPQAATNLAIIPDNGESASDALSNSLSFTLGGDLPEAGLSVRISDRTTGDELGYATVTGNTFSHAVVLDAPGNHEIRVRTVDAAGNLADSFFDVFIDITAPGVVDVASVSPSPRTTPVATLDVTLDEIVNGFDWQDVSLTRNGSAVVLDNSVSVTLLSGKTYRIGGLTAFTGAEGDYVLTVSAVGLTDRAGNAGFGSDSSSWTVAAVLPTGIRGVVYLDQDGDGVKDTGENLLAGRTVFLDANADGLLDAGEASITTGADGSYAFNDLAAGDYHVNIHLPSGWSLTAPASGVYNVTLGEGQTLTGRDFGNFQAGTISGVKFHDLDADGTRDATDPVLSGWTIFLDADSDGVLDAGEQSVVTGADGSYSLTGIQPGLVLVGEVQQEGWTRTTAATPLSVVSGLNRTVDVGNVQLASISGVKYNDLNGNGVRDADEAGIAGWTIFLDRDADGALDLGERSTQTDASGIFVFDSLVPGTYTVAEVQLAGWTQTAPGEDGTAGPLAVTTTASAVSIESASCACGGSWAVSTGTALIDYGAVAIDSALALTGVTSVQADTRFAGIDGSGIRTVIIDTGIDLDHAFFGADADGNGIADRIVFQYDFANGDADASDVNGHGSHIASLIGSQDDRYGGVATGTDLIVLKVFADNGKGTFAYLEQALQWVVANQEAYDIGVVNLSLGDGGNWTDDFSRYGVGDEFAALAKTDTIVVAASGNNYLKYGQMGVAYPSSDPAVLAVGSVWAADFGGPWKVSTGAIDFTTGADHISAYSQRDTELLDVFAPGARFNGANANGGIQTMQGTSQAAAFVSGIASLAQQIAQQELGRGLTTGEFAALIEQTSDWIIDGDDEIDNVINTGASYQRINFLKLAERIANLGETGAGGGSGFSLGGLDTPLQQAAAGVHTVALNAGDTISGKDFGNFELMDVSGTVFGDANGDGLINGAESGIAGWTVFLDGNANGSLDAGEASVITDGAGAYSFANLGPAEARVTLVPPSGWHLTGSGSYVLVATSGLNASHDFGVKEDAAINTPPTAVGESYTARTGELLAVDAAHGALINDSDPDGDAIVVSQLSPGSAGGTLQMWADGHFEYRSAADFMGAENFTLYISDSYGAIATETLTFNVVPDTFKVTSFSQTDSGLHIAFNHAIDSSVLNLYSAADNPMGAADLVLTRSGDAAPIRGSLVLDADGLGASFVKTKGVFVAGDYTLTLSSRSDGWKDLAGRLLDGNGDDTAGDNHVRMFTVAASTSAILSVGEFAAGPGVDFKAAGATGSGLPVSITNAAGATSISFKLAYDPNLFSVTGVSLGSALPAGSSIVADYSTAPGVVNVSVTLGSALGSGTLDVVRIQGTVPLTAISSYGSKQVLVLHDVSLNGGALAVRADDGLHVNAYAGDTTGLANYTTLDQQQLDRVIRRLDTGFGAFPLADPIVIADVNNTRDLNSADSLLLARKVAGLTSTIPSIPGSISPLTAVGPDPLVDIPRDLTAQAGGLVTVPVRLDTATYLESAQFNIGWDAEQLQLVEIRRGSLTEDFQWFVSDRQAGSLAVDMSRLAQMDGGQGTLLELVFRVATSARGSVGIDLQMARLNDTRLTLDPAPQVGADPTDGLVQITTDRGGEAAVAGGDTGSGAVIDFTKSYSGFALADSRGGEGGWLSDWLKDNKSKGKQDFLRIKPKAVSAPTRL
jgi:hypothetical protein